MLLSEPQILPWRSPYELQSLIPVLEWLCMYANVWYPSFLRKGGLACKAFKVGRGRGVGEYVQSESLVSFWSTWFCFVFNLFCVNGCLPACMSVPMEVRRQHGISWNWSYWWLWATIRVLWTKLRSRGRAVSAFNYWAISLAPVWIFFSLVCMYMLLAWVCVHVCMCMYMCIQVCVRVYRCVCTSVYVCIQMCMYLCVPVYTGVYSVTCRPEVDIWCFPLLLSTLFSERVYLHARLAHWLMKTGRRVSSRDPSVSTFPVLGLQGHTTARTTPQPGTHHSQAHTTNGYTP